MRLPFSLLLFLALPLSALTGSAAVSSLGIPSIDGVAAVSYNQWLASSFVADETAPAMLVDSISLKMTGVVPNQHVFIAITGSLNDRPNMADIRVIADTAPLYPSFQLNSVIVISLDPVIGAEPPVLLPGQEYWLVFGVSAPDFEQDSPAGVFLWSYAATESPTESQDGWRVGKRTATGNTAGQNWSIEQGTPLSFGLTMTPVPEPGSAALLAGGAFLLLRRRSGAGRLTGARHAVATSRPGRT